ncbi:MAG: N-acetylglucosamine-6-phosphate deacetylase [Gemmatimonadetes bacterium]|nr:N-acetylglucosamine-6-phosphate deacetylase [Gemmatimonadota bacterium]
MSITKALGCLIIRIEDILGSDNVYTLTGAEVLMPGGTLERRNVVVQDGAVARVEGSVGGAVGESVDLGGLILSPGFVDIHLNGGGGASFEQGTSEAIQKVIETGFQFGTTGVVAAINTAQREDRMRQMAALADYHASANDVLLGVHLEGPYYHLDQRGAHHPEWIRYPDPGEYGAWIDAYGDLIRIVTSAPELPGGMDLIRTLSKADIVPSIGHSMATDEQVDEAIEAGARMVTHIYNAQSTYTRRDDGKHLGVAEMGLMRDALTVEIIPDNRHLTPRMQQLVVKVKPHDKICITTDAIEATGQGPGTYELMGGKVWVDEEVAYREDRKRHAGSILTMDRAVRNVVAAGAEVGSALMMATEIPARTVGASTKGRIEVGADADFVVLNTSLEVVATISRGRVVYSADA